jgi:hypothetical protein
MEIPNNTSVECLTCGNVEHVNFGGCLQYGWPECHGLTMRLTTTSEDIEKATGSVVKQQLPRLH